MSTRRLSSLSFVLTSACNLRCAYCYRADGESRASMSWDVLWQRLQELLPQCRRQVECAFTGGEPLLAMPVLRRAVEEGERLASRLRRRISWKVLTNGVLLDDENLAFLEAHRFRVNLSFDGVDASQRARGAGTFGAIDRLIEHIYRHYPLLWQSRLRIAMTLTPENVPALAETARYFLRKGLIDVSITPAMGRAGCDWQPDRIDELDRQFSRVSDLMRRHVERTGWAPIMLYRKFAEERPAKRTLWSCLSYKVRGLTIDTDGLAYACVLATTSYRRRPSGELSSAVQALAVGDADLAQLKARRAAVSKTVRRTGVYQHPERRFSSYRQCGACEYLGRCQACPLAAANAPGWDDPRRVPDFLCAFNQVSLAHRDRFPCQPSIFALGASHA